MGQFRERSEIVRVKRLLEFYRLRGVNRERVNEVYRLVITRYNNFRTHNSF